MNSESIFFKFPSTPHLGGYASQHLRGDKVLASDECEVFLRHEVIIEEKIDGANLGISFDDTAALLLQNRGGYLNKPYGGQWKPLDTWAHPKVDMLFEALSDRYILFGEWCYAMHSIYYDSLPDWFIGFDIYDKFKKKFFSLDRRNALLARMQIAIVPMIAKNKFTLQQLEHLSSVSTFGRSAGEGLYIRYDTGEWLGGRAKFVRPNFLQKIDDHWTQGGGRTNRLARNNSQK